MKISFKHFIKHLECKLYINPKTQNFNINKQTFKLVSNISHLYVNIVSFLAKIIKIIQTLKLNYF